VTVVTTLVCFLHCTRGCGRIERPAFPAPSILREAKRFLQTSGASRRGNAESYLNAPSLRGAKRRSNPSYFAAAWIASLRSQRRMFEN
jgi:hypothetical protein